MMIQIVFLVVVLAVLYMVYRTITSPLRLLGIPGFLKENKADIIEADTIAMSSSILHSDIDAVNSNNHLTNTVNLYDGRAQKSNQLDNRSKTFSKNIMKLHVTPNPKLLDGDLHKSKLDVPVVESKKPLPVVMPKSKVITPVVNNNPKPNVKVSLGQEPHKLIVEAQDVTPKIPLPVVS